MAARIKVLESSLHDLQAELETQHNKMLNMQAQATYAEQQASATAAPPQAQSHTSRGWIAAGIAGLAVLAGLVSALWMRLRKRPEPTVLPRYAAKAQAERAAARSGGRAGGPGKSQGGRTACGIPSAATGGDGSCGPVRSIGQR